MVFSICGSQVWLASCSLRDRATTKYFNPTWAELHLARVGHTGNVYFVMGYFATFLLLQTIYHQMVE
jgi:hypothetical protein